MATSESELRAVYADLSLEEREATAFGLPPQPIVRQFDIEELYTLAAIAQEDLGIEV